MERKIVKVGSTYYVSIPKNLIKESKRGHKVTLLVELKSSRAVIKEVKKVAKRKTKRRRDMVRSVWGENTLLEGLGKSEKWEDWLP